MSMVKEVDFTKIQRTCSEKQVREGARNLLVNGCGVKQGTELVILNENGLVEPNVADILEQEAHRLGAVVYVIWADSVPNPESLPQPVMAAITNAEVTLMNHLLAASLRLVPFDGTGLKMMNMLFTWNQMGSAFGRTHYEVGREILKEISPKMAAASEWHMTCPLGTDLRASVLKKSSAGSSGTGDSFTLLSFQLSVSGVYSNLQSNGKLAVQWVTPSTTRVLNAKGICLPSPVLATVENGRMIDFEGDADSIAQLKDYLQKAGDEVGKDGFVINSWHGGTHPRCGTDIRPTDDMFAWILLAHGNPALTHLHVIGEAPPGEGSLPLLDPTITFDGEAIWEKGELVCCRDPEFRARISQWGDPDELLHQVRNLGI
ncbi:MAG: hypothetical protein DRQ52_12365 [Gammaproteobacteria bacterium]|nr:MAG: hypothetical protein DRQ52_12365 [Gammaproteobacteria bacterium]